MRSEARPLLQSAPAELPEYQSISVATVPPLPAVPFTAVRLRAMRGWKLYLAILCLALAPDDAGRESHGKKNCSGPSRGMLSRLVGGSRRGKIRFVVELCTSCNAFSLLCVRRVRLSTS